MPYEVTWEPRGVVKTFRGHLSSDDFHAAHRAITEDLRLGPTIRYVINDLSAVESVDVDAETLYTYRTERIGAATYLPNIRGAMVASSAAAVRLCELLLSPEHATLHELRLFRSMEAARAWLAG